jgi:hypothetical protein
MPPEPAYPQGPWGPYPANGSGGGSSSPSFGEDTTVTLLNAAADPVAALELITALTDLVPGNEASEWTIKLLEAGTQVVALNISPGHIQALGGIATAPGYSFADTDLSGHGPESGLWFDYTFARTAISAVGNVVYFDGSGPYTQNAAGRYSIFGDCNMARIGPNGDMQLTSANDIVIGPPVALATNATKGFLQIPTSAGAPTGIGLPQTGKALMEYDSTNNKIYISLGSGVWKSTAALT